MWEQDVLVAPANNFVGGPLLPRFRRLWKHDVTRRHGFGEYSHGEYHHGIVNTARPAALASDLPASVHTTSAPSATNWLTLSLDAQATIVSQKQSKLFSSELRQIYTSFDNNFWHKDGQDNRIV